MIERLIIDVFNPDWLKRYSRDEVRLTASKVVSSGDSGDSEDCYDASFSWSQIARGLDTDYQQNVTLAVAVIIENTHGTASQQLTIFIKPYRPQPFLVIF